LFQAGDGIRDRNVTGVQTCALPICTVRSSRASRSPESSKRQEEDTEMASKKGVSSTRNGRDSNAQRLGVKRFGGQDVNAGEILEIGRASCREWREVGGGAVGVYKIV